MGDTVFRPDFGTARADFPGGDAQQLFQSIRRILALPGDTLLYMCHDYPSDDETPQATNTVEDQRLHNVMINDTVSEADYIASRNDRDGQLPVPKLILPSLQVNIRAGELPPAESNQVRYLKIPINQLGH